MVDSPRPIAISVAARVLTLWAVSGAAQGVQASDFLVDSPDDVEWTFTRNISAQPLSPTGGGLGSTRHARQAVLSSISAHDDWSLGHDSLRYSAGRGPKIVFGSYDVTAPVWDDRARLGGIALSGALYNGAASESRWKYSIAVGALNYTDSQAEQGGFDYGTGASDVVLEYSLSPDVQLASQVQWAPDMLTADFGAQYLSNGWGDFRFGVAGSRRDQYQGWRYRLGYDVVVLDGVQFSWTSQLEEGGFSDLSEYASFSPGASTKNDIWSARMSLGSWGDLTGSYERVRAATAPLKEQFVVSQQFWQSRHLQMSLTARRDRVKRDFDVGLQLSMPLY